MNNCIHSDKTLKIIKSGSRFYKLKRCVVCRKVRKALVAEAVSYERS